MRLLLFCFVFFVVSIKSKFLMIKTESEPKEQMDSRVNDDVVNEMDYGQAVGSDYQDRDPILDFWIHNNQQIFQIVSEVENN